MATYNKFQQFLEDVFKKKYDFSTSSDVYKFMLTNTLPVNTNTIKANITDITAANGYSAGGTASAVVSSAQTSGTMKVVLTDVTITASGGTVGPFQWVVLYNDTQTSPAKPLVAWWALAAATTLQDGDSLLIDTDGTNGIFQAV
jgi:hypothetical protein